MKNLHESEYPLSHCPFCGSAKVDYRSTETSAIDSSRVHRIECLSCGASSKWVATRTHAEIMWNQRQEPHDRDGLTHAADEGLADRCAAHIETHHAVALNTRVRQMSYIEERDAILDKINEQGIESLTAEEHAALREKR